MPKSNECFFCGRTIAPGTGSTYIRKDGRIARFCSSKCRKSSVILQRDPRKFKWCQAYDRV